MTLREYFKIGNFPKTMTGKIVILNTLVFIVMFSYNYLQFGTWELTDQTASVFGAVTPHQSHLYTIFTYMFLHGGLTHILMNSLSLTTIGLALEKKLKKLFYPAYLISGIVSGIAVYLYGKDITVGASGAICGIWAMLIVYQLKYMRTKFLIGATIFDLGMLIYVSSFPKVSAIGHYTGFTTGLIMGLIYFTVFYVHVPEVKTNEVEVDEEKEIPQVQIIQRNFNHLENGQIIEEGKPLKLITEQEFEMQQRENKY